MKEKLAKLIQEYKDLMAKQDWKLIGILMISIIVLDQVSKQYFNSTFKIGEDVSVIGDFFRLTLHKNEGIAFGIRIIENRVLFSLFSVAAAIFIFFYLISLNIQSRMMYSVIGLIMGGAVGNLIDRVLFGKVIDFLDFDFPDIPSFEILGYYFSGMNRWPIFNVADAAVSSGMVLIIYLLFKQSREEKQAKVEKNASA